ncbi:MAG: hypothetical protein WC222_00490 [Parachlamydiales bacterium]|jgi:hypothetical protein
MPPVKLQVREVFAVILFAGVILGASFISFVRYDTTLNTEKSSLHNDNITAEVIGAVKYPGVYTVSKHTAIPHLINQAQPLDTAAIYPNLKIQKNSKGESVLAIPTQGTILVCVSGSISEVGWKTLPEKTRICDLPAYLTFLSNADKKFLKRKRLLRNGEHLNIP